MTASDNRKSALAGLKSLSMRQMRRHEAFWSDPTSKECMVEGKPVLFWLIEQAESARKNHDSEGRLKTLSMLSWLLSHDQPLEAVHRGNTVLMDAAINGDRAVARRLIKGGANIHAISKLSNTPLHWAAMAGQPAMCKLLLESGAELDACNQQRQTPLHCAADHVRLNTIGVLHNAGASWEGKDVHGRTPLDTLRHRDPAAVAHWAQRPERDRLEKATTPPEAPPPKRSARL